jgi:hypothetical protein
MSTPEQLIVQDYQARLMTPDFETMPFPAMVDHIRNPEVLKAAHSFFSLLSIRAGVEAPAVIQGGQAERVNVRVLLAGHLCLNHPVQVFRSLGFSEQRLLTACRNMHAAILHVIGEFSANGSFDGVAEGTWDAWKDTTKVYLRAFNEWKGPDLVNLLERLKNAFLLVRRALSNAALSDTEREEIHGQLNRLRGKIIQLSSQAEMDAFEAANNMS